MFIPSIEKVITIFRRCKSPSCSQGFIIWLIKKQAVYLAFQ